LGQKHFDKVLYFDFAKAFDVVSIPKLMYKLGKMGICGRLYSCIKSFLSNRSQRVVVGGEISDSLPLTGTPQGSVLGPILFLLFINDLPEIYPDGFCAKLFADDLKSYNLFDYRSNPDSVQSSLDRLSVWSNTWQLKLAVNKCGSILLKGNSSYVDCEELSLNDNPLTILECVTDLGVLADSKLFFRPKLIVLSVELSSVFI
jgi:hypothetical protein